MIRADEWHTPRAVWATSAIAAVLLHGILLWWGLMAGPGRRAEVVDPTPIRLVTLSENAAPTASASISPPSPATLPQDSLTAPQETHQADSNPSPAPTQQFPRANPQPTRAPDSTFAPVPPTDRAPVPPSPPPTNDAVASSPAIAPSPAPSPPPQPPVASPPAPAPPAPSSPPTAQPPPPAPPPTTPPAAPPSPNPTPGVPGGAEAGTGSASPVPPSDPGIGGETPASPGSSGSPSTSSGIQSWWSLQPVPGGGSDIHEQIPQMPSGWQASTSKLLTEAGCTSSLNPGASVRLTLWPAVDAAGYIFEFLPWAGNSGVPPSVRQCVESLRSQMPPLIPAQDGGQPIASDEVLLVIELRGTP